MTLLELVQTRVVLADGAMGTELQRAGLPPGQGGDWWCLARPDRVEAIHQAYRDAGADVLVTNSFGANRWGLDRRGYGGRVEDVNRAAAQIARRIAGPTGIVLGDIGPSGQLLEPLGTLSLEEVRREFMRQAQALVAGGVDGVIVETMSDLQESVAAVQAAREAGASVVAASMTFDKPPNGRVRTLMGVSPEDAAEALRAAGADVVGANCGTRLSAEDLAALVVAMREAGGVPVLIKPNAGEPRWDEGRAIYDTGPVAFARNMQRVVDAGARIVGGCCGTTPAHIAALREMLRRSEPEK